MMTSKAKYALRAMIDLAARPPGSPVLIAEIARSQAIPRRFLENILLELKGAGLLVSQRGKAGGYQLARAPDLISFADVLRVIDGPLALTPCTSRLHYRACEDCPGDERACAVRAAMLRARDATAAVLEQTTLAQAVAAPTP